MTEATYRELMNNHVNAWAVWGKDDPEAFTEFIWQNHRDDLKPGIIFLGLNPSKSIDHIRNFHAPKSRNDKRLKDNIQGPNKKSPITPNLFGGFMTDLVHSQIDSDSSRVRINPDYFKDFEEVLDKLGQEHYTIICFGGKVYEAAKGWLTSEIKNENIVHCTNATKKWNVTLYKVMHYSYRYGENVVGQQLKAIDSVLMVDV